LGFNVGNVANVGNVGNVGNELESPCIADEGEHLPVR
jgi:hypothetical protein